MARDADMHKFLSVCLALTAEWDREALLSSILDAAMDFGSCDAGTLYLLEDNGLRFCRMVTRSQGVRQGGHDDPITLPPVPMKEQYVCAWAAMHHELLNGNGYPNHVKADDIPPEVRLLTILDVFEALYQRPAGAGATRAQAVKLLMSFQTLAAA